MADDEMESNHAVAVEVDEVAEIVRWRAAGTRLRRLRPRTYAGLLAMLVACALAPATIEEDEDSLDDHRVRLF